MHTVHQIVVEESPDNVITSIEGHLAYFSGNKWFDWYQVGGRWDGLIASQFPHLADQLADPNILPVFGNETEVEALLNDIDKIQDSRFLKTKDVFAGHAVTATEVGEGHVLGFPIADSEAAAERLTKYNMEGYREWKQILEAHSLQELDLGKFFIIEYNLEILSNFLSGRWFNETGYYDFFNHSAHTKRLREELGKESTKYLHIVTVDFHF